MKHYKIKVANGTRWLAKNLTIHKSYDNDNMSLEWFEYKDYNIAYKYLVEYYQSLWMEKDDKKTKDRLKLKICSIVECE